MGFESELLLDGLMDREAGDFGGILASATLSGVPCSLGPMQGGTRLTPGGFSLSNTTIAVVRKAALPAATTFRAGQQIVVTDKLGNVRTLKIAADGANDLVYCWELTLEHPARNQ